MIGIRISKTNHFCMSGRIIKLRVNTYISVKHTRQTNTSDVFLVSFLCVASRQRIARNKTTCSIIIND